ncbi:MAG: hypothetical protein CL678_00925 [Bdellovibrionaceae bacterium]|nr:hypothetical protein [Pseudobdellovibrionaceae bacterium]|tara:strand:- start:587 stop:877 length:291 start_codon:yes stop_codon:yes gene_type:complete
MATLLQAKLIEDFYRLDPSDGMAVRIWLHQLPLVMMSSTALNPFIIWLGQETDTVRVMAASRAEFVLALSFCADVDRLCATHRAAMDAAGQTNCGV